jgi:hypothetical protein
VLYVLYVNEKAYFEYWPAGGAVEADFELIELLNSP